MKRLGLFILLIVLTSSEMSAQVSIDDCYNKARTNYPLIRELELMEKSQEYNVANAATGYLPQVSFSAKASYQSEVTKIPITIQGVKGMSKDQYGLTMDINQSLWDGGAIRSRQEGMRTATEVNKQNVEVALYNLRQRINQLFFGALLIDEQLKQNDLYLSDLQKNLDKISAYIKNGVAHQADADAVQVEMLKAEQNRIQLAHQREAYIGMLSQFTGEKLATDVVLQKPDMIPISTASINRPELKLYDAQIRDYEARRLAIKAATMPKIGLFLTGGYGRPGLNMLDNSFSPYYIGGIRLTWNLSSLYTRKNDIRMVDNNIGMVQSQRQTFLLNTGMDITNKESNIDAYEQQMKYDDRIIALRQSVRRSSEAKMANGTLSGIDLVRDMNAENMARQDKCTHEIKRLAEIYELKYATNQ